MSTPPLLSICIPTYKRPDFLSACLDGLSREDLSSVEIVVRDNGSHDETETVLRRYQETVGLRYEIAPLNEGPDRNFGHLVRIARGDYIWLLGDDDMVTSGSVAAIKQELATHRPMLLQLGYIQGSSELEPQCSVFAVHAGRINEDGTVVDKPEYLKAQPNVSLLFAFISSFIFARTCWNHGTSAERWYGTHYVHAYQIHAAFAASASPKVIHLSSPCVLARGNIPNLITSRVGEIMWLDARTLADICRTVYGGASPFRRAFGTVFRKAYSLRTIASVLAQTGKTIDETTRSALIYLGHSAFELKLATWMGRPSIRSLAMALTSKK